MPSEGGPLGVYGGKRPPTPDWFEAAVSARCETAFLDRGGRKVHYRRWGHADKRGLLLVHGNGAHAHWWDFIAPYFAEQFNVVAITLAGMGDSDWRDSYDLNGYSDDQLALADATGMLAHAQKPIAVAHSFGGFVSLNTSARHSDKFGGMVLVDSPVMPPNKADRGPPRTARAHKIYPNVEAALARFRLAPPQLCDNHFALDYIARKSLKPVTGEDGRQGWVWKFDPAIWRWLEMEQKPSDVLQAMSCRLAIIRGEESALMPDDVGVYMQELLGHQVSYVSIPHARHHVMLDQPLAFVAALRMMLAEWDNSTPHRGSAG